MASIHKFMFDTRFDDQPVVEKLIEEAPPAEAAEAVAPEPEQVFTAEDVTAAREEGVVAGREEANRAALESIEAKLAETIDAIAAELTGLFAAHEDAVSRAHAEAISVAAAVAGKLFPSLNEKHGLDEVTAVVEQALTKLTDEPQVIVTVAPVLADTLRARIEPLIRSLGARGDVEIVADDRIALGDCRLIWSDGASERDGGRLQAEIEEIVARHAGGAAPATPSAPEIAAAPETPAESETAKAHQAAPEAAAAPEIAPEAEAEPEIAPETAEESQTEPAAAPEPEAESGPDDKESS